MERVYWNICVPCCHLSAQVCILVNLRNGSSFLVRKLVPNIYIHVCIDSMNQVYMSH